MIYKVVGPEICDVCAYLCGGKVFAWMPWKELYVYLGSINHFKYRHALSKI